MPSLTRTKGGFASAVKGKSATPSKADKKSPNDAKIDKKVQKEKDEVMPLTRRARNPVAGG